MSAARALVDVHVDDLYNRTTRFVDTVESSSTTAVESVRAARQLKQDVEHLSFLTGQIPRSRSEFIRAIADIVLPTSDREA